MVTWTARRKSGRSTRHAARRAARSPALRVAARAGLAARGVMYLLVGWLAIQIAFGHSSQQADQTGALHTIAATPVGGVLLWLLAIGFAAMTLWRLSEAVYGSAGQGDRKPAARWSAAAKAVVYAVIAYSVLRFAVGAGSKSSDKQTVDLTATAMKYPGGRVLVIVAGVALLAGGVYLAYQAWRKRFLDDLQLSHARTRRIVTWLGQAGGIARGTVFGTSGVFLIVAGVRSQPQQAKGADAALRSLAAAPLGPWLLVLVALGLVMFGAFSCCEAKWARL